MVSNIGIIYIFYAGGAFIIAGLFYSEVFKIVDICEQVYLSNSSFPNLFLIRINKLLMKSIYLMGKESLIFSLGSTRYL